VQADDRDGFDQATGADGPLTDLLDLRSACLQLADTLDAMFSDLERLCAAVAQRPAEPRT
jgi:hypothetical protein